MIKIYSWFRIDRRDNERGIALAAVVGMAAVLFVLAMTALTYSVSTAVKSKTDSDSTQAIAAAYAGVSDYQARLTNDNTYQKYGDPTAPFSVATGSTNLTLPVANPNPAFGWGPLTGTGGTWAGVPGAIGNSAFRYEVDNSQYANQGVIRIRSTGRSGNVTRSVIANVRQKGFLDYLYFTDYETTDPAITGTFATAQTDCTQYFPTRPEGSGANQCGNPIQFGTNETINGPLHSNDAIYVCGGTFNGPVTTSYSTAPYYRNCGAANFTQGVPSYADKLTMPPTNSQMKQETRGDLTATDVPRPGCLFTGPTTIKFTGDGYMTVRSPWTKAVNTGVNSGTGLAYAIANSACGTPGRTAANSGTLGADGGQSIQVRQQNLVFVQNIPSVTTDPNYWMPATTPSGFSCPAGGNGLGFPVATTTTSGGNGRVFTTSETLTGPSASKAVGAYSCAAGDAFVSGSVVKAVSGQVTIAAENYIWVTSDLKYKDPASDVLGLVGQNAVWVWNPYMITTCSGNNCPASTDASYLALSGREIDAAVISVKHTFQVQNYDKGDPQGQLTVLGAIAQTYRGTVGTSSGGTPVTGFLKNYSYDARFRSIAPPKFLQAVSTTYGISQFSEVPPAFNAAGVTN